MATANQFIDSVKVSSVLNKDHKEFGKQNLIDGSEETCWNSDKGESQWIIVNLKEKLSLNGLEVQFQGGFSSRKLDVKVDDNPNPVQVFYPEDSNCLQKFDFQTDFKVSKVMLQFSDCVDFFGRIIIYKLNLL